MGRNLKRFDLRTTRGHARWELFAAYHGGGGATTVCTPPWDAIRDPRDVKQEGATLRGTTLIIVWPSGLHCDRNVTVCGMQESTHWIVGESLLGAVGLTNHRAEPAGHFLAFIF